jgi:DNA modification methylase
MRVAYEVRIGDALTEMRKMDKESVDSVITSPPYFGLRAYTDDEAEIGREETPEAFIESLVAIFQEVKRVLKPEGTFWLNIGDTYWGGKGQSGMKDKEYQAKRTNTLNKSYHNAVGGKGKTRPQDRRHEVFKPKDLMLLPHRLAIALQEDGWWVRNDIIWAKPNPMPESTKDRCTKSHEHIFLLTKSKKYYYDADAISTPLKEDPTKGANRRDVWNISVKNYKGAHFATYPPDLVELCLLAGCPEGGIVLDPFAGSGTTAGVAEVFGRDSILIELNEEYAKLIPERVNSVKNWYLNRKP